MSDFKGEIRQRLKSVRVDASVADEVIEEISYHLESTEEEFRSDGLNIEEARRQSLVQVGNWEKLVAGIRANKEIGMKDRLRRLWVPALGTGVLACAAQTAIYHHLGPQNIHVSGIWIYSWPWLVFLVATGAIGAYWSRSRGGNRVERVVVALAPAEVMAIGLLMALILEVVRSTSTPYVFKHPGLLVGLFAWIVLLPAIPSMVGASAFLRGSVNPQNAE